MPTGYTADIYEGKQVSGRDFILTCARAFGALVSMRDDSLDVQIPNEFIPSTYHKEALEQEQSRLNEIMALSEEDIEKKIEDDYQATLKSNELYYKKLTDLKARYESTLAEVKLWEPPTPDHIALKEYAIGQLQKSIEYDCGRIEKYLEIPKKPSTKEWLENRIESANWGIEYHTKSNEEEIRRAAENTDWVKALKESLKTDWVKALRESSENLS
jgi:hypothetical protein